MKDNFGRAIGTCIVGLGLLAFVISAPGTDTRRPAYSADVAQAAEPAADPSQTAEPRLGQTGQAAQAAPSRAEAIIAQWPDRTQRAARKLIEKYGQPNDTADSQLTWFDNSPWRKTIVYRDELEHNFPVHHFDSVQQWISYRVPVDKLSDLGRFDGSVIVDRTAGLISARGDGESDNFLALNLANDIVRGNKSVDEARQFYGKTAMMLVSGKSTPYTEGLLFRVDRLNAADPDRPVVRADAGPSPRRQAPPSPSQPELR